MNKIDILEELKEWFNNFDLDSIKHKPEEYIQAISTLIAENKELKGENEGLKTKLDTLIEKYKELKEELDSVKQIYYTQREIEENYILKSKVKAKIKQLDYNDIGNYERRCKQEVLQELLGKE